MPNATATPSTTKQPQPRPPRSAAQAQRVFLQQTPQSVCGASGLAAALLHASAALAPPAASRPVPPASARVTPSALACLRSRTLTLPPARGRAIALQQSCRTFRGCIARDAPDAATSPARFMMEPKRKANGAAAADPDNRLSKRRKLADFDLSKGETRESTTAYGMSFLEQIRRTADKSGRLVATYFEKLLPREENEEYYKRTRMPISLETVEAKLTKGDFQTLAELESYFKRMISNAKDFYPRSSPVFDDAERMRKALSNYMTKTNPAYATRRYQAQPTPLPPEEPEHDAEEDAARRPVGDDQDAEGEDADKDEQYHQPAPRAEPEIAHDEEEEMKSRSMRRRSIVLKRRESCRLSKSSEAQVQPSPRPSAPTARPDHQHERAPYVGFTFQQAQEKVLEELFRHNEPDYEAYFEPFYNLPPRSLKDYYRVVADPVSLKKIQKMVKGVHSRGDTPGVSEFKSWAAFEEKSKLLWANAYYYNEEGSEIFELAQELEKAFYKQLEKARAVVQEPSQPKIKLKVGQAAEAPTSSKKITIHVGGRGGSTDSPVPSLVTQPAQSPAAVPNGTTRSSGRLEAARSASASMLSLSPSRQVGLKTEDIFRISPAVPSQTPVAGIPGAVQPPAPTAVSAAVLAANPAAATSTVIAPAAAASALAAAPAPAAVMASVNQPALADNSLLVNGHVEPRRLRGPGKGVEDALISQLRIQLHPHLQVENHNVLTLLPNPREFQQSATISLAPYANRVFIILKLPDLLQDRHYSLWVLINKYPLQPTVHPLANQLPQERAFEVVLHPGVNVIEAHLIAALPRSERGPGEPEVELEVITVLANLMRPS